jgi:CRP-like cAMP-binding protein
MRPSSGDARHLSLSDSEHWIGQIPLFTGLLPQQREALLDAAVVHVTRAGEVVLREGQELEGILYFLVAGEFQVSKLAANGKETILRVIGSTEGFGLAALFDETTAPATLTSTRDGCVMRIPSGAFLEILRQDFNLTLRILKLLSQRLREAYQQVHLVASTKGRARLAQLIGAQADRAGLEPDPEGWALRTPLSYATLSRMAGVSYEETIRILQEWGAILQYRRGRIVIRDLEGLRAIALGE